MISERIHFEQVDSTNTVALSYARSDLDHGIVIVADEQTAGRGRVGRTWTSPKGNLYCSILLPPFDKGSVDPRLSLLAANAVYETVADFINDRHGLSTKWPNDILVDGKKVSGILLEACDKQGKIFCIVGIGINIVAETLERVPPEIADHVTALHLVGDPSITRDEVLESLVKHIDAWYARYKKEGASAICSFWNQHCNSIGRTIEIPSRNVTGVSKGINERGQLIVETESGEIAIDSDEIRFTSLDA